MKSRVQTAESGLLRAMRSPQRAGEEESHELGSGTEYRSDQKAHLLSSSLYAAVSLAPPLLTSKPPGTSCCLPHLSLCHRALHITRAQS